MSENLSEKLNPGEKANPGEKLDLGQSVTNELLKILVAKTTSNETEIRKGNEAIRKLPEIATILQEIGKRMTAQTDRITAQETALADIKSQHVGALNQVWAGMSTMAKQISIPTNLIAKLSDDLKKHEEFFEKPRQKEVHHRHYIGKALWLIAGMWAGMTFLSFLLIFAIQKANRHAENDIKWRCVVLSPGARVNLYVDSINRNYNSNPDQFQADVKSEEERQQALFERQREKEEAEMKIFELESEKKSK